MSGSVERAKDVGKAEYRSEVAAVPAVASSPADLLKKAVSGKTEPSDRPSSAATPVGSARRWTMPFDGRLAAAATVALVIGIGFGMVSAPRERSGDALSRIEAALEAGRTEAGRLGSEVERLSKALASVRETTEAARSDIRAVAPAFNERSSRLEQSLDKKLAALGDRVTQAARQQATAPAATPTEQRAAIAPAVVASTGTSTATSIPKTEPTQTASLADAKPKPETVDGWALRDVYQGIAMLEDRKRRLLEVGPGDSVPGVGRVESIERRGRNWVVITRQGVIVPQPW